MQSKIDRENEIERIKAIGILDGCNALNYMDNMPFQNKIVCMEYIEGVQNPEKNISSSRMSLLLDWIDHYRVYEPVRDFLKLNAENMLMQFDIIDDVMS